MRSPTATPPARRMWTPRTPGGTRTTRRWPSASSTISPTISIRASWTPPDRRRARLRGADAAAHRGGRRWRRHANTIAHARCACSVIPGGTITQPGVELANSPYLVTGNLLVASGVTLTIDPGVVVDSRRPRHAGQRHARRRRHGATADSVHVGAEGTSRRVIGLRSPAPTAPWAPRTTTMATTSRAQRSRMLKSSTQAGTGQRRPSRSADGAIPVQPDRGPQLDSGRLRQRLPAACGSTAIHPR